MAYKIYTWHGLDHKRLYIVGNSLEECLSKKYTVLDRILCEDDLFFMCCADATRNCGNIAQFEIDDAAEELHDFCNKWDNEKNWQSEPKTLFVIDTMY